MWNIYVSAVMIFYAPSYKNKTVAIDNENNQIRDISMQSRLLQYDHISTTESIVTTFAKKISAS